ncbi:GNAT family N-acetyltransferase [Ferrimonas sp. SCSIO 43195]|uniref:GNAT family N-acetyltransferase n=1 Tax=Ferrimonas sp. SCSIO 43195 TaxID=2822844 RepID=UPI0020764FDD|nr:GNAT family N-acetyltransferase [Ferrimonas sp. SCSIO 43195]USD39188.1 GNAT family N-acetyltransferase [Ferrimonas sp. SCSIO 43195]
MKIRKISPQDDQQIAEIIREVLTEFGANRPGFAWQDPELDRLSEVYTDRRSGYWVAELEGTVVGGVGIAPFECHWPSTCELQKMYLKPSCRGKGVGQALLAQALAFAEEAGFHHCYLETFGPMSQAQNLYRRHGFEALDGPWGNSGHNSCDCWMMKAL